MARIIQIRDNSNNNVINTGIEAARTQFLSSLENIKGEITTKKNLF